MSLTIGRAPLARPPAGQFNFNIAAPERVLYFEESPRRVRVVFNDQTVADSGGVKLLHETGPPVYYFPVADVRRDLLRPSGQTIPSPHKGVEVRSSLTVGERTAENAAWSYSELPDSAGFLAGHYAFQWDAMDAWYEDDEQVFVHARDPYHRAATARGTKAQRPITLSVRPKRVVRDVIWYYPDPYPEAAKIKDRLAFYNERVEIEVNGERV
jgi:uncharacterized protein (DUF427 family)